MCSYVPTFRHAVHSSRVHSTMHAYTAIVPHCETQHTEGTPCAYMQACAHSVAFLNSASRLRPSTPASVRGRNTRCTDRAVLSLCAQYLRVPSFSANRAHALRPSDEAWPRSRWGPSSRGGDPTACIRVGAAGNWTSVDMCVSAGAVRVSVKGCGYAHAHMYACVRACTCQCDCV